MKTPIAIIFVMLSTMLSAQNVKLGDNIGTQEYLKQASACCYTPQWTTPKDSVELHLKRIETLANEIDLLVEAFMKNKYTETYLGKMAQDYATKIGSSPGAILAMSEATESIQTIGAKIAELNTKTEAELGELKSLDELYNECGLNLEVHFSGLYDAKVDKNRKIYAARFPAFYNQAMTVQKQALALRKSHLDAVLKLQYELVGALQKKYDGSKLMMLEQFLDQQKAACYLLIQEYTEFCEELLKPYRMYRLRDEKI